MRNLRAVAVVILLLFVLSAAWIVPAVAATAEPTVIAVAWYWEPQTNQDITTPVGSFSGELANPYCPTLPGSLGSPAPETCAEWRLPVEVVNRDHETPDKVSAMTFDMSFLPLGATVSKFELVMLEAESGCREDPNTDTGQRCEQQTDAVNAEDKEIQACEVKEIFGDGEARQYKEMPKFTCTDLDPKATRKETKNDAKNDPNDQTPDHIWTFDLTAYAQKWAETPPQCTCIMFRPVEPQEAEQQDTNWKVVFAGPKVEGGIQASIKFSGGDSGTTVPPPSVPPPAGTGSTGSSTGSIGTTTGSSGGGSLTGSGGGETPTTSASPSPGATELGEQASADVPKVEMMPGYVWIALLAGVIGFSMVRSVVLDKTLGHRPNGVLAQIHQINAARGGGAAAQAAAGPGPLSAVGSFFKPIAGKIGSVFGKLTSFRKG